MSNAAMAQLVEHILGKDEVPSSNLGSSSKKALADAGAFWFVRLPPAGGGYPICGSVGAAPGGLSGIALGFSRGFARRLLSSTAGERGFARFLSLL